MFLVYSISPDTVPGHHLVPHHAQDQVIGPGDEDGGDQDLAI